MKIWLKVPGLGFPVLGFGILGFLWPPGFTHAKHMRREEGAREEDKTDRQRCDLHCDFCPCCLLTLLHSNPLLLCHLPVSWSVLKLFKIVNHLRSASSEDGYVILLKVRNCFCVFQSLQCHLSWALVALHDSRVSLFDGFLKGFFTPSFWDLCSSLKAA
jgi:hypothetical protein